MYKQKWLDAFVREYTMPSNETAARIVRLCNGIDDDTDPDAYHTARVAAAIECAEAAVSIPGLVALWSRAARDSHAAVIVTAIEQGAGCDSQQ